MLACQTGRAPFIEVLSQNGIVSACIAPFRKVHGAVASQFCQAFMVFRLLEGEKIEDAHTRAADAGPHDVPLRRWTDGALTTVER